MKDEVNEMHLSIYLVTVKLLYEEFGSFRILGDCYNPEWTLSRW